MPSDQNTTTLTILAFAPEATIMESIGLRGKCPICGQGPLRPLAMNYHVNVTKQNGPQPVGGLLVYQCTKEGHIFFVMAKDAEENVA